MQRYTGHNPDQSSMGEMLGVAGKILGIVAIVYALAAVLAHFVSLRMIFPKPPITYEMGRDYVWLTASDGTKIAARHWANPSAKYTILYFHGNYQELGGLGEYMPDFVAAGYAVFAFDYRGYGHSGGETREANVYSDARLAYEYVRRELQVPADRIIVYGYSLGSGPAVELALHEPAAGLVLQGPFLSAYRVMTSYPLLPGDKFVNAGKVAKLKLPVMVIHGTSDGVVPFWHGEVLYRSITVRKASLFVDGGPHNGLAKFVGPRYWEELRRFTDSL